MKVVNYALSYQFHQGYILYLYCSWDISIIPVIKGKVLQRFEYLGHHLNCLFGGKHIFNVVN